MRQVIVFNNISLDGFFTDAKSDMSFFHKSDLEWTKFSAENSQRGDGTLLFGRKTYDLMASFWPTPAAKKQMPETAEGMNRRRKVVFSKSLKEVTWENTTLLNGDVVGAVKKLKQEPGDSIVIMGSGTIVSQLAEARLIDSYTLVIVPIVIGSGRTLFEGVTKRFALKRVRQTSFENGNIVAVYEP